MAGPLGERTWEEVAAHPGRLLAVPLGATEQHGPHLPLDTDTRVALALARSLADRRSDVLVAPALAYGSSGEHAGFAGTVSIGQTAVELVILELARGLGADYEVALTLEALARTRLGDSEAEAESRLILERLGVLSTPQVPLP